MNQPRIQTLCLFLFILLLSTTQIVAQEISWKKLATEAYPGKQDDIVFVDENNGWYVNGYGKIYHTTDGGATWEKQLEKKGSFFRTIAFIDKNIGFVGTVGTDYFPNVSDTIPLYGTKDGGKTWQKVDLGRACNKIRIYQNEKGQQYGYAIGVSVFKF